MKVIKQILSSYSLIWSVDDINRHLETWSLPPSWALSHRTDDHTLITKGIVYSLSEATNEDTSEGRKLREEAEEEVGSE